MDRLRFFQFLYSVSLRALLETLLSHRHFSSQPFIKHLVVEQFLVKLGLRIGGIDDGRQEF